MTKHSKLGLVGMAAVAAVVTLAGCGSDGPSIGSALTAPGLSTAAGPAATDASDGGSALGVPTSDVVPPTGGTTPQPNASGAPGVEVAITGQPIEVTKSVTRHFGGTIVAGRFKLILKNKDLAHDTVITLRDISGVTGRVECEILPAGLALGKHVQLTANFSDVMSTTGCALFRVYNPGSPAETWYSLGGLANPTGISAHISTTGDFAPAPTN